MPQELIGDLEPIQPIAKPIAHDDFNDRVREHIRNPLMAFRNTITDFSSEFGIIASMTKRDIEALGYTPERADKLITRFESAKRLKVLKEQFIAELKTFNDLGV